MKNDLGVLTKFLKHLIGFVFGIQTNIFAILTKYPYLNKMNAHKYSQLIFDKGTKAIRWSTDNLVNKWWWDMYMQK